jgi:hypothetical protein
MKRLPLLFVSLALVTGSLLRADDPNNLVKNGDFADGSHEWEGDARVPDPSDAEPIDPLAPPTTTTAPTGVVVKLRAGDWSSVHQDFSCQSNKVDVVVTYKLSMDCTFSDRAEDYANISDNLQTGWPPHAGQIGKWTLFLIDMAGLDTPKDDWIFSPNEMSPAFGTDEVQTAKASVRVVPGDHKGIFLTFPPGKGTVTLLSVVVTPSGDDNPQP